MFININRPSEKTNFWNTFVGNIFLLLFSGGILLVAHLFPLEKLPLGFCVFLNLTGIPCPTCGFTRAFCAFAHENWEQGISNCPFALILFVFVALVFIYNTVVLVTALFGLRIQRGSFLQLSSGKTVFLAVLFFLLLMANWIYRLIVGLK